MRKRHHKTEDAEINITPMLDIVFIMLIFFIVTTSFVKESGIDMTRPSNQPPKTEKISDVIFESGLALKPDASVVVAASRDADAGLLVRVVDQARVAGAERVSVVALVE